MCFNGKARFVVLFRCAFVFELLRVLRFLRATARAATGELRCVPTAKVPYKKKAIIIISQNLEY